MSNVAAELRAFKEKRWKYRPTKYRLGSPDKYGEVLKADELSLLLERAAVRIEVLEKALTPFGLMADSLNTNQNRTAFEVGNGLIEDAKRVLAE